MCQRTCDRVPTSSSTSARRPWSCAGWISCARTGSSQRERNPPPGGPTTANDLLRGLGVAKRQGNRVSWPQSFRLTELGYLGEFVPARLREPVDRLRLVRRRDPKIGWPCQPDEVSA